MGKETPKTEMDLDSFFMTSHMTFSAFPPFRSISPFCVVVYEIFISKDSLLPYIYILLLLKFHFMKKKVPVSTLTVSFH